MDEPAPAPNSPEAWHAASPETMPVMADFIAACREYFGAVNVDPGIKAGRAGQATFWASENGIEIGVKSEDRGIPLSQLQIGPLSAPVQAGKARQ